MTPLQNRILLLLSGDGVAYQTLDIVGRVNSTWDEVWSALVRLETSGYIWNQGPDLWDEDDEDYRDVWQLTKDGSMNAEAMR